MINVLVRKKKRLKTRREIEMESFINSRRGSDHSKVRLEVGPDLCMRVMSKTDQHILAEPNKRVSLISMARKMLSAVQVF